MTLLNSIVPISDAIFQIAWESTLKCNFDCSYCADGHNNLVPHPTLEDSLKTVDFIFEYLDVIMAEKNKNYQMANLNIQGGESLFHPQIIEILEYITKKKKDYSWTMNVALITNGATGIHRWSKIVNYLDYVTMSFHAESDAKYHKMFKNNCLHMKELGKNFQINVLMHPKYWNTCVNLVSWANSNQLKVYKRQIDHHWLDMRFNYSKEQVEYITDNVSLSTADKLKAIFTNKIDLSSTGRACCGGKTMCTNSINNTTYIKGNNFKGWHCSVDKFFLYIRQSTGEVFTNKDCRMDFDGKVGPIGNLREYNKIIERIKQGTNTIICKKSKCWCGLCAPKAATKELFQEINRKYAKTED